MCSAGHASFSLFFFSFQLILFPVHSFPYGSRFRFRVGSLDGVSRLRFPCSLFLGGLLCADADFYWVYCKAIFFFLFSMFPFEGFESVAFLVWCFGSRRFTCYSVVTVRRYVFFCLYLFVVLFPLRVSSRSRNAVGRPVSSESECKERAGRESTAVWKSRVASPNSLNLRLIRELNSVTYFAFLRLSPPLG